MFYSINRPSQKLKIKFPYDPVITVLGIFPKELETRSQTGICTHEFTAALFTTAKNWKQSKCPPKNRLTKCGIHMKWDIIQP